MKSRSLGCAQTPCRMVLFSFSHQVASQHGIVRPALPRCCLRRPARSRDERQGGMVEGPAGIARRGLAAGKGLEAGDSWDDDSCGVR